MPLYPFQTLQAIGQPVLAHIGRAESAAQQSVPIHAEYVIGSCDPERAAPIFRNPEYRLAQ